MASNTTEGERMPTPSESLKQRIADALARNVAPALDMDGTQLEVLDVADGIARIRLGGACGNCPSSIMAAVMGIEQELRKHVPEVEFIEAVP
jgi:Fe-S cluster biogenesis protein NfuA